jgi:tRNA threonylcarbamoyladenosine biosynthesis protein TsaB
VLAFRDAAMMHGQAEALLPMADDAMREAGIAVAALDVIAVTIGPGSFTGIRVGLAAARGIALAGNLLLIGVSSFEAVAAAVAQPVVAGHSLLIALESRRADLYIQLFGPQGDPLSEPMAVLPEMLAAAVGAAVGSQPFVIAGNAAARAADTLAGSPGMTVVEEISPSTIGVVRAAFRRWRQGDCSGPVKPLYLRPPDVTPAGGRRALESG